MCWEHVNYFREKNTIYIKIEVKVIDTPIPHTDISKNSG